MARRFTDEEIIDFASQPQQRQQDRFGDNDTIIQFATGQGGGNQSEAVRNENRKRSAIIESSISGRSVIDTLASPSEKNDDLTLNDKVDQFYNQQKELIAQQVDEQVKKSKDKEEAKRIFEAGSLMRRAVDNAKAAGDAERVAYLESLKSKPASEMSMEELRRLDSQFDNSAWKDVASLIEDKSFLDKSISFLGSFIPFTATEDFEDLTNEVFGADDAAKQMINNFQNLDPRKKAAAWPFIRDKVVDDMNDFRAASVLSNLLRPGGAELQEKEVTIDQVFDAIDAATLGAGVVGKIAKAKQASNAVKAARDAANRDLAADANSAAMVSEDARKTADVSKEQAAQNAQPLDFSEFSDAHTDDISPEVTDNIEQFQQQVSDEVTQILNKENVLVENVLEEAQRNKVVAKVKDKISNNVEADLHNLFGNQIRDIQYKVDEGGVTLEATIDHPNNDLASVGLTDKKKEELGVHIEREDVPDILNSQDQPFSSKKGAQAAINSQFRPDLSKDTHVPVQLEDGGWVIRPRNAGNVVIKKNVRFTADDREAFEGSERISAFNRALGNPTAFPGFLFKESFRSITRAENVSAKIKDRLFRMQQEALKPLGSMARPKNRRKLERVEKALFHFDEYVDEFTGKQGREATIEELKGGIWVEDNKGNLTELKLDDSEIEAFGKLRRLYDGLYALENDAYRRSLQAKGLNRIPILGTENLGKVTDSAASARGKLNTKGQSRVLVKDVEGQEFAAQNVDDLDIEELYNQNYRMAKLEDTVDDPFSGESFQTAFVKTEDIKDIPDKVLNYRDGYVPKINQDDVWIVRKNIKGVVDGKRAETSKIKTMALADNKADAMKMRDQLDESAVEGESHEVLQGSEIQDILDPGASMLGSGGGLFTSSRASHDIFFNSLNKKPQRLSIMDSTQRNIQHTSNFVPASEIRVGIQQSWVKSFNQVFGDRKKINEFPNDPERIMPETKSKEARSLLRLHEQIQDWQIVPHKHEQIWQGAVQNTYEWALGKGFVESGGKAADITRGLRSSDPAAQMRSISFHSMLGMFNPIQLIVQAQNSVAALAIEGLSANPLRAADAIRGYYGLRAAMMTDNPETLKKISKGLGMNEQKFMDMQRAFKKSGLVEGIRTNPDLQVAGAGGPTAVDGIKRALDAGLIPFREGEIVSRGTAFSAAFNRWKRINPNRSVDDEAIKEIADDANRFMLNMGRSNRARWQRGFWSVPTQFLQVQSKIIQNMVPGLSDEFSTAEKAKLWIGQASLYGAAGFPLGEVMVNGAVEQAGLSQQWIQNNKGKVKAINQGLWGALFFNSLGLDFQIANRLSVTDGVEQMVADIATGNMSLPTAAIGAFGQVPSRVMQEYTKLEPIMMAAAKEGTFTANDLTMVARSIGRITSTWRQADKAIFQMHMQNQLTDRSGVAIEQRDFSLMEELAAGLGLKPGEVAKAQDFWIEEKTREQHARRVADTYMQVMTDYVETINLGEATDAEQSRVRTITRGLLGGYPEEFQRKVRDIVKRRMKARDQLDKRQSRIIEDYIQNRSADAFSWYDLLRNNGVLVLGEPGESNQDNETIREAAEMNKVSKELDKLISGEGE